MAITKTRQEQSDYLLQLLKDYAQNYWEIDPDTIDDEYAMDLLVDAHIWIDEESTDMVSIDVDPESGWLRVAIVSDDDEDFLYNLSVRNVELITDDMLTEAFDVAESLGFTLY